MAAHRLSRWVTTDDAGAAVGPNGRSDVFAPDSKCFPLGKGHDNQACDVWGWSLMPDSDSLVGDLVGLDLRGVAISATVAADGGLGRSVA